MTHNNPAAAHTTTTNGKDTAIIAADLDLTPHGLEDAPAHQEDPESIVYTGNS